MKTFFARNRRGSVVACLVGMACAWVVASLTAHADELPRYKLAVGQELVYRTTDPPKETDDGKGGKQSNDYVTEWVVDVVRREASGEWWLVFRQKITAKTSYMGKERKQEYQTDGHFLLSPEGKFIENATLTAMCNPAPLFPALPTDVAALKDGWHSSLTLDDTKRDFRVASAPPAAAEGEWFFVERPVTALDPIYEMTSTRNYTFDRAAGRVRKTVMEGHQGWPKRDKEEPYKQTIELVETRQLDTSDLAAIEQQARKYFAVVEEYDRMATDARGDFRRSAMKYIEAGKKLDSLDGEITLPWLKEMLEGRKKQHKTDMNYAVQDAVQFAKLLDQPSEEWKTTDLDDQPRSLQDYRGQVVVLDFWYRGCGWCIRAMPQMKQLASDFAGQKVAILGINSDQNLDDARYVIDLLKLNYPTLKNGRGEGQINTMYKIHGWPTLVVIDQKGVIRHVHYGYSTTLRSELSEKIRELLAEPGA